MFGHLMDLCAIFVLNLCLGLIWVSLTILFTYKTPSNFFDESTIDWDGSQNTLDNQSD